jgi:hypothetical protein
MKTKPTPLTNVLAIYCAPLIKLNMRHDSPMPQAYAKSIERLRKGRELYQAKQRALERGGTNRGRQRGVVQRDSKGGIIPQPFQLRTRTRDRHPTLKDMTTGETPRVPSLSPGSGRVKHRSSKGK